MPAGIPAAFAASIDALSTIETDKDFFLQMRLTVTEQRTLQFNKVYSYMQAANAAALNIYNGNESILKLFDLPTPPKKEKKKKAEV